MITYARDHSVADGLNYIATWQTGMFQPADMTEAFTAKAERRDRGATTICTRYDAVCASTVRGAVVSRRCRRLGRAILVLEVAEAHERRADPPAHGGEVFVEARAVGQGLFVELVDALVGDLDGVLGVVEVVVEDGLDRGPMRTSDSVPIGGLVSGSTASMACGSGWRREPLDAQHDLDVDAGRFVERLADVPVAIRGLRPRRPAERDVGAHPRREPFARQPVGGLPGRCRRGGCRSGSVPRMPDARAARFRTPRGARRWRR